MEYTITDIVESRNEEKKKIDKMDVWVYYFVRPLSFYVTYVLMKFKITANQATLISTLVSLLGSALLFTTNRLLTFIGLLILNLWIVFDCVDGNIARTTKKSSVYGEFLDGVSGYLYTILLYISLSVNVFLNSSGKNVWLYLVLGSFTSIATILPRLIEHKAVNMFNGYNKGVTDKNSYSLFYIVGLNIAGMAGLSNPIMIVFYLFGILNYYVIFYFIVHVSIAFLTVYKIISKIKIMELVENE